MVVSVSEGKSIGKLEITRMWANAQRDGCPAKCRWRPLFNAAKWLTPTRRSQDAK